jgi:hypothetical protein
MFNLSLLKVNKLLALRGVSSQVAAPPKQPPVPSTAAPDPKPVAPAQPAPPVATTAASIATAATAQTSERDTVYPPELKQQAIAKYLETKNFSETALSLGIKDIFAVVRWVKEHEGKN